MQPTAEDKQATSADLYFDQKARFSLHEGMIKDRVRTKALHGFVAANKSRLRGATVLVIGSGIGLLSFALGRQGAHVIGIESSAIVHQARQLAADNGLHATVTFVHGEVGKVELPVEDHSVDLIVCEWMGHLLTNDIILRQLIRARDRYLKPEGAIVPNRATLFLSACHDRSFKTGSLDFWDNVYGFTMRPMKKLVLREPVVSLIPSRQMVTRSCPLAVFDAATITLDDLAWERPFELVANKNREYAHYLVAYFVAEATLPGWQGFRISTSPESPPTHWQQTAFCIQEDLPINVGDKISGVFKQRVSEDGADTFNTIDVKLQGKHFQTEYQQHFHFRNA